MTVASAGVDGLVEDQTLLEGLVHGTALGDVHEALPGVVVEVTVDEDPRGDPIDLLAVAVVDLAVLAIAGMHPVVGVLDRQ